jgi:hypothetical protein
MLGAVFFHMHVLKLQAARQQRQPLNIQAVTHADAALAKKPQATKAVPTLYY